MRVLLLLRYKILYCCYKMVSIRWYPVKLNPCSIHDPTPRRVTYLLRTRLIRHGLKNSLRNYVEKKLDKLADVLVKEIEHMEPYNVEPVCPRCRLLASEHKSTRSLHYMAKLKYNKKQCQSWKVKIFALYVMTSYD